MATLPPSPFQTEPPPGPRRRQLRPRLFDVSGLTPEGLSTAFAEAGPDDHLIPFAEPPAPAKVDTSARDALIRQLVEQQAQGNNRIVEEARRRSRMANEAHLLTMFGVVPAALITGANIGDLSRERQAAMDAFTEASALGAEVDARNATLGTQAELGIEEHRLADDQAFQQQTDAHLRERNRLLKEAMAEFARTGDRNRLGEEFNALQARNEHFQNLAERRAQEDQRLQRAAAARAAESHRWRQEEYERQQAERERLAANPLAGLQTPSLVRAASLLDRFAGVEPGRSLGWLGRIGESPTYGRAEQAFQSEQHTIKPLRQALEKELAEAMRAAGPAGYKPLLAAYEPVITALAYAEQVGADGYTFPDFLRKMERGEFAASDFRPAPPPPAPPSFEELDRMSREVLADPRMQALQEQEQTVPIDERTVIIEPEDLQSGAYREKLQVAYQQHGPERVKAVFTDSQGDAIANPSGTGTFDGAEAIAAAIPEVRRVLVQDRTQRAQQERERARALRGEVRSQEREERDLRGELSRVGRRAGIVGVPSRILGPPLLDASNPEAPVYVLRYVPEMLGGGEGRERTARFASAEEVERYLELFGAVSGNSAHASGR